MLIEFIILQLKLEAIQKPFRKCHIFMLYNIKCIFFNPCYCNYLLYIVNCKRLQA